MLGLLDIPRIDAARRVYWGGGISPTLTTNCGTDVIVIYAEENSSRECDE